MSKKIPNTFILCLLLLLPIIGLACGGDNGNSQRELTQSKPPFATPTPTPSPAQMHVPFWDNENSCDIPSGPIPKEQFIASAKGQMGRILFHLNPVEDIPDDNVRIEHVIAIDEDGGNITNLSLIDGLNDTGIDSYGNLSISQDGHDIAFTREEFFGGFGMFSSLWVIDIFGQDLRRVSSETEDLQDKYEIYGISSKSIIWSPDGDHLFYIRRGGPAIGGMPLMTPTIAPSPDSESRFLALTEVDIKDSSANRIIWSLKHENRADSAVWDISTDLDFMMGVPLGDAGFFKLPEMTPTTTFELPSQAAASVKWSPNGENIVFEMSDDVYLASLTNHCYLNLTELIKNEHDDAEFGWFYSNWRPIDVVWSSNGQRLLLSTVSTGRKIYEFDLVSGAMSLIPLPESMLLANSSSYGADFYLPNMPYPPDPWSNDMSEILLSVDGRIALLDLGTNAIKYLTSSERHDSEPAWSPDKTKITFVQETQGKYKIMVMDADGSNLKPITQELSGYLSNPIWIYTPATSTP